MYQLKRSKDGKLEVVYYFFLICSPWGATRFQATKREAERREPGKDVAFQFGFCFKTGSKETLVNRGSLSHVLLVMYKSTKTNGVGKYP